MNKVIDMAVEFAAPLIAAVVVYFKLPMGISRLECLCYVRFSKHQFY